MDQGPDGDPANHFKWPKAAKYLFGLDHILGGDVLPLSFVSRARDFDFCLNGQFS